LVKSRGPVGTSLPFWDIAGNQVRHHNKYQTILLLADSVIRATDSTQICDLLSDSGLLFVYGNPDQLPAIALALESQLTFKYWIALRTISEGKRGPGHKGLLLFSKGDKFPITKVRVPHPRCRACGKTLRDWGGKSHLMHPDGAALSDVWDDLAVDPGETLPVKVLKRVASLAGLSKKQRGLIFSRKVTETKPHRPASYGYSACTKKLPESNMVYQGDCIEIMRNFRSESVDLAFADPPYNLAKNYQVISDDQSDSDYIDWCNSWLTEYVRVLKPGGALFVLNLPKWANHHFMFLNRIARFHRWIVWDALSEPRGKLMPAHYALLQFVKAGGPIVENSTLRAGSPEFCVRASCINHRRAADIEDTEQLGDVWSDVFRLKHKSSRDSHPCQLPEKLMERIINLSTKSGDIVLDAFCGAGTTAVTAARLGRRYITIDINPDYVAMAKQKLNAVGSGAEIRRSVAPRPKPVYSKKELQLDLQRIALKLGRLPKEGEIDRLSNYPLAAYKEQFPTLSKALKAAKLVT